MTLKKQYTLDDFDFYLPKALIAQHPLPSRTSSRLLCVNRKTGVIQHRCFDTLPNLLSSSDLLVFNNTMVMKARLQGRKATGGKLECLIERIITSKKALAHLKASKTPPVGSIIVLGDEVLVKVEGRNEDLFYLTLSTDVNMTFHDLVEQHGHIPLPPYIKRQDIKEDLQRYQTVYAKKLGAIAAPTAGLHFDQSILNKLRSKGVESTEITLHVGSGTFLPIRVNDFSSHIMHAEYFEISKANCDAVERTWQKQNGRVVADGTTVVRTLETAAKQHYPVAPLSGQTRLFIHPGFQFKVVDALLTNFHLPKSTLMMLVCAFGGYDLMMHAYQEAVKEKYRFFSYGDAMFIY